MLMSAQQIFTTAIAMLHVQIEWEASGAAASPDLLVTASHTVSWFGIPLAYVSSKENIRHVYDKIRLFSQNGKLREETNLKSN